MPGLANTPIDLDAQAIAPTTGISTPPGGRDRLASAEVPGIGDPVNHAFQGEGVGAQARTVPVSVGDATSPRCDFASNEARCTMDPDLGLVRRFDADAAPALERPGGTALSREIEGRALDTAKPTVSLDQKTRSRTVGEEGPGEPTKPEPTAVDTSMASAQRRGASFTNLVKDFVGQHPAAMAVLAGGLAAYMGGGWKGALIGGAVGYFGSQAFKAWDENSQKADVYDRAMAEKAKAAAGPTTGRKG